MADERVEALISLGIDEAKAKRSIDALKAMDKATKDVDARAKKAVESLRKMAETGAKMREVGAVTAGMGAAILAPLTLAANSYAERYKGLEAQANKYNAVLYRQKNATADLGRTASTALLPILDKVVQVEERIAAFAAAHPELVKAAAIGGAGLAIGGGALIMAGTAVTTIAKAAELLTVLQGTKIAAFASGLGTAVVSVGALYAGAKLAEKGLQEYGKATGDARLEHYKLSDALKTAREAVSIPLLALAKAFVDAKVSFGRVVDIVVMLWDIAKVKVEDFFDKMVTGSTKTWNNVKEAMFKVVDKIKEGFASVINSLIRALADIIDKVPGMGGTARNLRGKQIETGEGSDFSADAANAAVDRGYNRRQQDRRDYLAGVGERMAANDAERMAQYDRDMAKLAEFAGNVANFAETGSLGAKADAFFNGIKDKVKGFFGGGSGAGTAVGTNPEAVKAFIDFQQKARDKQRQDEKAIADLKRQYDDTEKKALAELGKSRAKINADFMKAEIKEAKAFYDQEIKDQKNANKERLRLLQDLNDTLFDAAANNDVVAFLNAQRQAEKDLRRQKEDQDEASQERQAAYLEQRQEARNNRQQALNDLQTSYNDEKQARRQEYQNQRNLLIEQQNEQQMILERSFAQQLASLEGNLGGLQNLQNTYYAQQSKAFADYLDANQTMLQNRIRDMYGAGGAGSSASGSTTTSTARTAVQRIAAYVPHFDKGSDYIPRDTLAVLHRGERVVPASQNKSGDNTFNFDFRGTTLSQDFINQIKTEVYQGVATAIAGAN